MRKNVKKVIAPLLAAAMVLSCTVCVSAAEDETIKLTVWGAEEDQNLLKELTDKFQEKYADQKFDIQIGVESESTAKDTMITAITEVTRSSISEKISYYQSKIAETNEGDPKLEFYKDLEDRYNNFLRVFDLMENNKRELKQKIKELTDIDIWQGSGNLEDYQNLLQLVEKLYLKK